MTTLEPGIVLQFFNEWIRMRRFLLLSMFCILAFQAEAQESMPEETAHAFYAWVLMHPASALPSPKERVQLAKICFAGNSAVAEAGR